MPTGREPSDDQHPPRPDVPFVRDASARAVQHAMRRFGLLNWFELWPGVVFALCAVVLLVVPLLSKRGGDAPPAALLAASGLVLGGASAAVLGLGVRRLGASARAAIAAGVGIFCVALVKFTFGPLGFYAAARGRVFSVPLEGFVPLAIATGGVATLMLYVSGLRLVYASFLRRTGARGARQAVTTTVAGAIILASLGVAAAVVLSVPGFYLRLLLHSVAVGMVVAALVFAVAAFSVAFSSSAEAAKAAGDVGMYTAVFGLCMAFLVIFHVLWIVYMLVLSAIWPLRTVTPK